MNNFSAHINEKEQIQTVEEHCGNVAAYCSEEGSGVGLSSTCRLAGLLHDIGKNRQAFQDYLKKAHENPKSVHRGEVNHSSAGGRYLYDLWQRQFNANDPIQKLTFQLISYAVISHHGLTDCLSPAGEDCFGRRIFPEKEIQYQETIDNSKEFLCEQHIDMLFSDATREISNYHSMISKMVTRIDSKHKESNGQFLLGCLQRLILSVLVDADRRDTAEFMNGIKLSRMAQAERDRLWETYQYRLENRLSGFSPDTKINRLRKEMSDFCLSFSAHGDGTYRLAIPTGGGKTYAGMRYALELARKTHKKHIFYIAPFLSILEQNAKDIESVFGDAEHILEHHSNIIVEDEDQNCENLRQYELLADDWSSPVILTTMVQFLNVLFAGGMQYVRRMHQLKESVIIIDEAQSVPVKCIHLFTMMMNFLSGCLHSTIVLCTATQPLFEKVERRMLYSTPPDMIPDAEKYALAFKRVDIKNALLPEGYDTEKMADFIIQVFYTNLLVICNTKSATKELYDALLTKIDDGVQLIQLTTYMCAAHRMDKITELKERLKAEQRIICVSTQLIEAGVDISFETVVRSVAGLDSVAQAAGRCNRDGDIGVGTVYIVNYNAEKTGALEDIHFGQRGMKAILSHYQGDLLHPEAMERFYRQYYFDRQQAGSKVMDYAIKGENTNLYDLLSCEKKYKEDYRLRNDNHSYPYPMSQAYKTAGKHFTVIDDGQMIGLLVPYGDGVDLIKTLQSTYDSAAKRKLLRKLQRYTVNVYQNDKLLRRLLERKAISDLLGDGSVFCVDEGYYKDTGIDDTMELLVF